jgi:hypothetical protein
MAQLPGLSPAGRKSDHDLVLNERGNTGSSSPASTSAGIRSCSGLRGGRALLSGDEVLQHGQVPGGVHATGVLVGCRV